MRKMFLHVKGRCKFIAALLLGVFINCISGKAQNVTVSEKTGSMICSQTSYEGGLPKQASALADLPLGSISNYRSR